ncbi:arylsulfatase [Stenotrophomonas sp.]|uniref:arylsulfatase n=1 Tax=Stenotrophomonas sp. TaxID=69392 RepID=UPI0028A58DD2|nr:arylsulfatase [Stenotrophomonas sp.]
MVVLRGQVGSNCVLGRFGMGNKRWLVSRVGLVVAAMLLACTAGASGWAQEKPSGSRPNIIVVLLDDVGFSDPAGFGGLAQMPAFDSVARGGLRFTNFNTTGMCSPTRASLLSGRNHHAVGFGRVADWATGTPGYDAVWKADAAPIAKVLSHAGYSTAAIGKWHNTPEWEVSPAGPFDRWPTGLGFDYFYGIMNHGGDNHWEPASLYRNTTPVEADHRQGSSYHLTADFVDDAIQWLRTHRSVAPQKPYFLYLATGAVHAPHHVPKEWIEKYKGRFDQGWDALREEIFARQKTLGIVPADAVLTPRPPEIPAWSALDEAQRKVFARQMEVFAAYLAHTDREISRLLNEAAADDPASNTVVFYVAGDNGASGMEGIHGYMDAASGAPAQLEHLDELGGPLHFNDYSSAWAWVGSTPFQWMKQVASHFGGLRVAMAVSWPGRITAPGRTVRDFAHVNDVAATILEVADAPMPAFVDGVGQRALDGSSFADTFRGERSSAPARTQYFEMLGNRALYQDGWIASARHMTPWIKPYPESFDTDSWELYNLAEDFSQSHDVAAAYPEKLEALKQLFDEEARRNNVYPLSNYVEGRDYGAPTVARNRRTFSYHPPVQRLPTKSLPRLAKSSFSVHAHARVAAGTGDGMLMAYGSRLGGFAWYMREGYLVFSNNINGRERVQLRSSEPVPAGTALLQLSFKRENDGPAGAIEMHVNGRRVARGHIDRLGSPVLGSLGVGQAFTSPVDESYAVPYPFQGVLEELTVVMD